MLTDSFYSGILTKLSQGIVSSDWTIWKVLKKAKKVVEEKYGQKLVYNENTMSIDIIYDDNNQITTDEISQLVQEVLNIVDTPKVKYPAEREFSTNVVNYYTLPALGVLQCYIEKNEIGETELFYFSDKSMEQSVIKEKIDKLYQSVEEWLKLRGYTKLFIVFSFIFCDIIEWK